MIESFKIMHGSDRPVHMNTALILAGGVGQRVGGDIPKQFLEVRGVPVIAYTVNAFQQNPDIDRIVVVCVDGWADEVMSYRDRFGISKLEKTIPGGWNSMQSISNGIFGLALAGDDIVIVHDSVRPLISQFVISDCIEKCRTYGNGCASIPLQETIVRTSDRISGNVNIDRSEVMRVQTPQAYRYNDLLKLYTDARRMGITDSVYVNTLMMELGGTIFFSQGSTFNIKITTPEDLRMFELFLDHGVIETPVH